ncbi:unnamed protein product, partial [Dicrocoelium dendriticum]
MGVIAATLALVPITLSCVLESTSFFLLASTMRSKRCRKSMPMMAKGTAAIMKGQRKVRRRPKLSVSSFSPKVAIGVPLAARSLVGDGETTSFGLRGITLTSAPVSTRNSVPEVKSLTRMRRLWCWPVASVAVTDRPSSFPAARRSCK